MSYAAPAAAPSPADLAAARLEAMLWADTPEEVEAIRNLSDDDFAAIAQGMAESGQADGEADAEPVSTPPSVAGADDIDPDDPVQREILTATLTRMLGLSPAAVERALGVASREMGATAETHTPPAVPAAAASEDGRHVHVHLHGVAPVGHQDDGQASASPHEPRRMARADRYGRGATASGADDPDAAALAHFYTNFLTGLCESGIDPDEVDEEADKANDELAGTGWRVEDGGQGEWEAVHDEDDTAEAYARRRQPLRYAAARAPVGGMTINGKEYVGGQFIPSKVIADATPEQRERIEQGHQEGERRKADRQKARRAAGPARRADLAERLAGHADAPLTAADRRNAGAAWRMLKRHHGADVLHRVRELADLAERGLKAGDERVAEDGEATGLRDYWRKELGRLHHVLGLAGAEGVEESEGEEAESEAQAEELKGDREPVQQPLDRSAFQKKLDAAMSQGVSDEDYQKLEASLLRRMEPWQRTQLEHTYGVGAAERPRSPQPPRRPFNGYNSDGKPKPPTAEQEARFKEDAASYKKAQKQFQAEQAKWEGQYSETAHRRAVEAALAAGKPVPPDVLAEYPDLKERAAAPPTGAEPAPGAGTSPAPPTHADRLRSAADAAEQRGDPASARIFRQGAEEEEGRAAGAEKSAESRQPGLQSGQVEGTIASGGGEKPPEERPMTRTTQELPALLGTPKQAEWAERIRSEKLAEAEVRLASTPALLEAVREQAAAQPAAIFWIDNRQPGELLSKLVSGALSALHPNPADSGLGSSSEQSREAAANNYAWHLYSYATKMTHGDGEAAAHDRWASVHQAVKGAEMAGYMPSKVFADLVAFGYPAEEARHRVARFFESSLKDADDDVAERLKTDIGTLRSPVAPKPEGTPMAQPVALAPLVGTPRQVDYANRVRDDFFAALDRMEQDAREDVQQSQVAQTREDAQATLSRIQKAREALGKDTEVKTWLDGIKDMRPGQVLAIVGGEFPPLSRTVPGINLAIRAIARAVGRGEEFASYNLKFHAQNK